MNEPRKIKIVGIAGSKRPGNYTLKALKASLKSINNIPGCTTTLIDPIPLTLPFPGEAGDKTDVQQIQESLKSADGIILATPEYHGSYSSVIKVIIENLGFPSELSGKPVSLLGVAQGRIGAIKSLESLRSVCSHVGSIVLPGAISIAGVQNVIDGNDNITDENTQKSLDKVGQNLIDYIQQHTCPLNSLESMVRSN